MKKLFRYSALITILGVLSVGCAYNPAPLGPPGKTVPAGAGSTYTYNNTPIDTNGTKLTDSSYLSIVTVGVTDSTIGSKTHVTRFVTKNLKTGLSTNSYVNFEDNGDISIYTGAGILSFIGIRYPDWLTYPIQSHASSGFKIFDSTVSIPGGTALPPVHVIVVDSISYINWSLFPINNSSLPVFNLRHKTHYSGTISVFGVPVDAFAPFEGITTLAFATSIGYYTDITTQPFHFPLNLFPAIQGSEMTLVSYSLK